MLGEPRPPGRHLLTNAGGTPIGPALDPSLIDRARNGDLDAFEEIVRARMDAVYRLTAAILGDEAGAADAAQETVVAAWRQIRRLNDPARLDAWLQRIAVNAARMTMRARGRRRVREIASSELVAGASPADVETPLSDARRLDDALRRLPVDQRTILALHHLEGRRLDEIAAILEVPLGTAKSRLFTARRALEAALRAEANDR
jgi:RNA polymerase sigma-70 factor (ECF subfamily)